jgi:signal peptidase I
VRRAFWNRIAGGDSAQSRRRKLAQRCGLAAALALGIFHLCCPFSIGVVQGSSMLPTYQPGQLFLLDRHYYTDHPISRGDVVVVRCDDHTIIKRVFGVAGDSIWLLIQPDGDRVDRFVIEPRMVERLRRAAMRWDIGRVTCLKVPRGSVYLLGDCTEFSVDSRAFGAVPITDILGRVTPLRPGAGAVAVRTAAASLPWDAIRAPKDRPFPSPRRSSPPAAPARTTSARG